MYTYIHFPRREMTRLHFVLATETKKVMRKRKISRTGKSKRRDQASQREETKVR